MICQNCGANVNDNEMFCQNCGARRPYTNYELQEVKSTGVLVASILEIIAFFFRDIGGVVPGLIALILILAKLNPAIQNGNLSEAKKIKKIIKIVLWIGLVLIIIFPLILVALVTIPVYLGARQDMQMKVDKTTAAQIGKAARIWYTEAKYEGFKYKNVEKSFVKLDEIDGFENYISTNQYVTTYLNDEGTYYVTIIGENAGKPKVVVAIGPNDLKSAPSEDKNLMKTFSDNGESATIATYDGTGSGIAYIEP